VHELENTVGVQFVQGNLESFDPVTQELYRHLPATTTHNRKLKNSELNQLVRVKSRPSAERTRPAVLLAQGSTPSADEAGDNQETVRGALLAQDFNSIKTPTGLNTRVGAGEKNSRQSPPRRTKNKNELC
jgi:hypothetical protein